MKWLALVVLLVASTATAAPRSPPKKAAPAAKASAKPGKKTVRAKGKRRATGAGYKKHVKSWHATEPGASAPVDASGRPKLVLESINLKERVELEANKDGSFSSAELARAKTVLRDSRGQREHTIDPTLIELLYKIQLHFEAPSIRVISAYRAGGSSRHARGQAADIVVPGAEDRAVAAYAKTLGTTGVGLYPASGFVHVDVRESSHYWVDSSGPGAPSHKAARAGKRKKPAGKAKSGRPKRGR